MAGRVAAYPSRVMTRRSIGFPLTFAAVLTLLAVVLLVGWQALVVGDLRPFAQGLMTLYWVYLILGTFFFLLIIVGLVLLCVWLVREMRYSQRQQSFLDAVTHEMKTPLASLRLSVDTLSLHDPPAPRREEFLSRMQSDLDRLEGTVQQVLAAARADARERPRERARIDLVALLARCIDEICERHRLPHDAVRFDRSNVVGIRGDEDELGLVFRNLLENAVKYSDPPVEIRVALRAAGDGRVTVEIMDRGIGIPRRELRKIFQRFYRAGRDMQRKVSGLGLGLFIVRNLVRRQGGRVVALSEGAGRGSRFVVTLRTLGRTGP